MFLQKMLLSVSLDSWSSTLERKNAFLKCMKCDFWLFTGNKYKVPEDVPAPGIDIAEYDRMMFDTDEASSSSGSDVQEFDEQNLYD